VATHGNEERRSIKHDNEQKMSKRRPTTGQVSTGQRKSNQGLVCIII